jgi:hypothetical protein
MNFKLKGYSGGIHDLAAKVRRAARKPLAVRERIAREIGMSRPSLDRYNRKLKKNRRASAFERKARNDKGLPRSLPATWAAAGLIALIKGPAQYSSVYSRLLIQTKRLGIRPPSYSTFRRAISERFRQLMAHSQIRRLGNFERRK